MDVLLLQVVLTVALLPCVFAVYHDIIKLSLAVKQDHEFTESIIHQSGLSFVQCTTECLSKVQCCGVTHVKNTSLCTYNFSPDCTSVTAYKLGAVSVRNPRYRCTGCVSFGLSSYKLMYLVIATWESSKDICIELGGKLAEIETSVENDLIKYYANKLGPPAVFYYWIGGYDYNSDGDLEWISTPNQSMAFVDWTKFQPNPSQYCLSMTGPKFEWMTLGCTSRTPFICEFT